MTNDKRHDIAQRKYDGKWVVWSQIDHPDADLDYYRKNGLPVPQQWIMIYVAHSEEEARRMSRRSRV